MSEDKMLKVLVVDDEPDLRELLADAIGDEDMEVTLAGSGREAIELASDCRPDILVMDLHLGDAAGADVIDEIRSRLGDIPAVVITGCSDLSTLSDASRRRPVEVIAKPIDLDHLRETIRRELLRQSQYRRHQGRCLKLRRLARDINLERKDIHRQLHSQCEDLTTAFRTLSGQLALQGVVIDFQRELLGAKTDDDIFCLLFRNFVRRSGPLFGIAMACDAEAELQIVGRFGVPNPDGINFCKTLAQPVIDAVLVGPQIQLIDASDDLQLFDESIRRYMVGVNILAIPLLPSEGQMIGLVVLYRKGEQPFVDGDLALAEMIAPATAVAVQKNG